VSRRVSALAALANEGIKKSRENGETPTVGVNKKNFARKERKEKDTNVLFSIARTGLTRFDAITTPTESENTIFAFSWPMFIKARLSFGNNTLEACRNGSIEIEGALEKIHQSPDGNHDEESDNSHDHDISSLLLLFFIGGTEDVHGKAIQKEEDAQTDDNGGCAADQVRYGRENSRGVRGKSSQRKQEQS